MIIQDKTYRDVFQELYPLRSTRVPFVFLDGTLPPSLEKPLMDTVKVTTWRVLRTVTTRPEIAYAVVPSPHVGISNAIKQDLSQRLLTYTPQDRAIVFVRSRQMSRELAAHLGCQSYYSGIDKADDIYKSWVQGQQPTIVSTTSLGSGIDISSIRDVYFHDTPFTMIDFAQQSGRGGRDRQPSRATVYYDPHQVIPPNPVNIPFGSQVINLWVERDDICRRIFLGYFLDGVAESCVSLGAQLCDVCTRKLKEARPVIVQPFPPNPITQTTVDVPALPTTDHRPELPRAPPRELPSVAMPVAPPRAEPTHQPTHHIGPQPIPSALPRVQAECHPRNPFLSRQLIRDTAPALAGHRR